MPALAKKYTAYDCVWENGQYGNILAKWANAQIYLGTNFQDIIEKDHRVKILINVVSDVLHCSSVQMMVLVIGELAVLFRQ